MAKPTQKDTPKKGTKADLQNRLNAAITLNSLLVSRQAISGRLGKQFSGDRDLYEVFGYEKLPKYDDYLNAYERDGIATRIAETAPDETWRLHPILVEGDDKTLDELDDPGQLQTEFSKLADEHDLWALMREADVSLAMSQFSLLFLGLPGKPSKPVTSKTDKLSYVTAHDQGDAEVQEPTIDQNPESPRFGLPTMYNIIIDQKKATKVPVHYTRVIHIKEGRNRRSYGRVYGTPRFQNMINRFFDMEKVIGGGSEAFWLLIRKGMALTAKDDMTLPDVDTPAYMALQDEISEYEHGLRRVMRLVGMDIEELGSDPVDSSGQFNVIISYLAGTSHIPQRILLGSERGELASSQDMYNLSQHVAGRQTNFAEPYILRPLVNRLGELGIMSVPETYTTHWKSLFQLNDLEKAELATKVAQAINTASGGMPEIIMLPEVYAKRYLDYVATKKEVVEMEEAKDESEEQDDEMVDVREAFADIPEGTKLNKKQLDWLINSIKATMPKEQEDDISES